MEIHLTPELEKIVNDRVEAGMYTNADEFIQNAILQSVEIERLKRKRLNDAIELGIEQLDNGESVRFDLEELLDELDNELGYINY